MEALSGDHTGLRYGPEPDVSLVMAFVFMSREKMPSAWKAMRVPSGENAKPPTEYFVSLTSGWGFDRGVSGVCGTTTFQSAPGVRSSLTTSKSPYRSVRAR